MTTSLVFYGVLGIATTVIAFVGNRRLFAAVVEAVAQAVGDQVADEVRDECLPSKACTTSSVSCRCVWAGTSISGTSTSTVIRRATSAFTKSLFSNWASDSAAQDYIMVNVVLLPLWTIVDGRRRGLRIPWIFFVMSLFTSLAFSMALFLAFIERQIRYNRCGTC